LKEYCGKQDCFEHMDGYMPEADRCWNFEDTASGSEICARLKGLVSGIKTGVSLGTLI
jgi:hypothetical protein